MNDTLTRQFQYLFRGRDDLWGAIHGEAMRSKVTPELWTAHLYGEGSLGIYPLLKRADGTPIVAWGCTDIDNGYEASLPLARNLVRTLKLLGITAWCERTKGKGFHVWVFVEGYVPAQQMRDALLFAHQVAGVAPTEVNPKSNHGGKQGNGNYVNLPYAKTFADEGRRVVLDPDSGMPMPLDEFVLDAWSSLNPPESVAKVAARYVPPPPPPRVEIEGYSDANLEPLVKRLPGLAYRIFQEGPLHEREVDGKRKGSRDRSGTLARLAHLCAEAETFTPGETLAVLVDADRRWGKFFDRFDGMEQLELMVGRAFGKRLAAK